MDQENSSSKRYRYGPSEGFEVRSLRRLQDDLGVNQAAAETILSLRSQVVELQSLVRQLEAELNAQTASQHARLDHYQRVCFEGIWIELDFQE